MEMVFLDEIPKKLGDLKRHSVDINVCKNVTYGDVFDPNYEAPPY
jgi:hypothetical protein